MNTPALLCAVLAGTTAGLHSLTIPAGTGSFSDSAPELTLTSFDDTVGPLVAVDVAITNFTLDLSLNIDVVAPASGPFDFSPLEPGHPLSLTLFDDISRVIDFPLDLARVSLDLSSLSGVSDFSASPDIVDQSVTLSDLSGSLRIDLDSSNGDLGPADLAAFFGGSPKLVPSIVFVDRLSIGEPGDYSVLIEIETTVVSYSGDYSISYQAIPEPSVLGFFGIGSFLLVLMRRR